MKPAAELAQAVAMGDLARVKARLAAEPALAKDWQPIMDACHYGRPEMVRVLLEHGADPNVLSKSMYRYRPLHRTVEHKAGLERGPQHLEVVELLLAAGADPWLRGTMGQMTVVAVAAMGGETQFLPLLLRGQAPCDLYTAAVLLDAPRVEELLAADPGLAARPDENGLAALDYCCGSRVAQQDPALAATALTVARRLLDLGAPPDGALGRALWTNNPDLVTLLLERGAMVRDGDSLVHLAEAGNFAVLDVLAERGADLQCTIGTEHHGGYTPLGSLMTVRSARGAAWFLGRGFDPNEIGSARGETALHVAVKHGCGPDMLKLLVEHGVRVDQEDVEGQTALGVARAKGKKNAVLFLEGIGASA